MTNASELKSILLEMMEWFHNFCVEHDLVYYAAGGTMLGAVRHNGFIPWDDDIDVVMPREDYTKLERLMQENKSTTYVLETPNTKETDYYYPFSKLYDVRTTLVENTKYKIKRGVYLDIFPLDGMGNSENDSLQHYKKIEKAKKILLTKTTGVRHGRSLPKNLAVLLFKLLPLNEKRLLKKVTDLCTCREWANCVWGGNPVGAWNFKEIMPKEIMGKPQLYQFENIKIYGAERADEYLTHLYGKWRELPPIEKRVSHHDYILCDLKKSYLED